MISLIINASICCFIPPLCRATFSLIRLEKLPSDWSWGPWRRIIPVQYLVLLQDRGPQPLHRHLGSFMSPGPFFWLKEEQRTGIRSLFSAPATGDECCCLILLAARWKLIDPSWMLLTKMFTLQVVFTKEGASTLQIFFKGCCSEWVFEIIKWFSGKKKNPPGGWEKKSCCLTAATADVFHHFSAAPPSNVAALRLKAARLVSRAYGACSWCRHPLSAAWISYSGTVLRQKLPDFLVASLCSVEHHKKKERERGSNESFIQLLLWKSGSAGIKNFPLKS